MRVPYEYGRVVNGNTAQRTGCMLQLYLRSACDRIAKEMERCEEKGWRARIVREGVEGSSVPHLMQ